MWCSFQKDLKSCSAALVDEWTAPTAKHRRSSSEFGLIKGDGWLKEFEGWRFKVNNGGYYADGSGYWVPDQIPSIIPKMLQPFGHYENCGKFWGYDYLSRTNHDSFDAFTSGLYTHFKWGLYCVYGSLLWWKSYPISVESLVACHDLLLLDDLIIWFCMSLLPLSFCYDSKVGEVDAGAFSSMKKDWGGLVLPVGHAPLTTTAVCVIGETSLFLMGCGRVFTENILVVCSMICIKAMSCSITVEISLSTRLEIFRVSDVLGGKVGVDFGLGKQLRSSGILHPALCTRFFPSLVFLYEGIYKALIDFGGINRATPFMFGLSEIPCVPQEGPPTPESCTELHEMAKADDRIEDHPRKA
ncbi:hypothetical protein V6N13_036549 [Hibiscus sabdariffa]